MRTMEVDVEILSHLSKLGHRDVVEDVEVFVPDPNPIKTLKAIRRLLNKDAKEDEDFGLESLSEVRAIQKHLIPLILATAESELSGEIIDEVTKLLVILTLPGTKLSQAHVNELRLALYEEAMANQNPLALLVSRVEVALETDASKRSEEDRKRVDLLLFLVRNLLYPSPSEVAREECLIQLESEAVLDIILHFTNHVSRKNNREWDLLLLEIYFYIFRGISPADLHTTEVGAASESRDISKLGQLKSELTNTLEELGRGDKSRRKKIPSRHSHFGGVLVFDNDGDRRPMSSIFTLGDPRKAADSMLPKSIAQRKRRVQDTSVVSNDVLSLNHHTFVSRDVIQCLRHVADDLVDKSYAVLFSSIIQDFRREDARIKPEDEVRFIWMVRFFSCYARLRKNWLKTSVMTTMDLWSFQFMVNRINDHLEQKAWASLETTLGALLEMMMNLKEIKADEEGKSLKNAVFYELRERLEVVPRLLKLWDPASMSRDHLKNLTVLADLILDTFEDMASEGAMAKARSKALKRAERQQKTKGVFNLNWSAEESFALAAGVKDRKGEYDLNVMRSILKDPALGSTFEDQKRTPQQLLARWMQIREALGTGKTLDQFVKEDLERQTDEDKMDEEAAKEEEPEIFEKQVDFFAGLRSYLSNNIYRNFSRLIDPASHSEGESALLRDITSQRLVAKFFRRLRAFRKGLRPDDSLEPMLWHVENFDSWRRYLALVGRLSPDKRLVETRDLADVIRSSLRRFFRLSIKNKLVFTEILFWRTKQDNVLISRFYGRFINNRKPATNLPNDEDALKQIEEELAELDANVENDEVEDQEPEVSGSEEEIDDEVGHASLSENEAEKESSKHSPVPATVAQEKPSALSKRVGEAMSKKSANRKQPKSKGSIGKTKSSMSRFKLDQRGLIAAVQQALRAGVTSEAFMCLVQALESMEGVSLDLAFIPAELDSSDRSFETTEMKQVMLHLGMRPPNRIISTRARDAFSCEVYWRILGSRMESKVCGEALRAAVLGGFEGEEISVPDQPSIDWCDASGDDQSNDDDDEEEKESDKDSISESPNSANVKHLKTRLRRVLSSDSEDEVDENTPELAPDQKTVETLKSGQKRRRVISDDED